MHLRIFAAGVQERDGFPGSYLSSVSNSAHKAKSSLTSDAWRNRRRLQSAAQVANPQQISRCHQTVRERSPRQPPALPAAEEVGRSRGAQVPRPSLPRKPVRSGAGWELESGGELRSPEGGDDLLSPNRRDNQGANVSGPAGSCLARRADQAARGKRRKCEGARRGGASVPNPTCFPPEFRSGRDSARAGIPLRETRCSSPRRS